MQKISIAIIFALLLFLMGWWVQKAYGFNPNELKDLIVIYDAGCRPYYCVIAKKDDKSYLIVLEGKQIVFIYEVVMTEEEMKLGDLLWGRDLI